MCSSQLNCAVDRADQGDRNVSVSEVRTVLDVVSLVSVVGNINTNWHQTINVSRQQHDCFMTISETSQVQISNHQRSFAEGNRNVTIANPHGVEVKILRIEYNCTSTQEGSEVQGVGVSWRDEVYVDIIQRISTIQRSCSFEDESVGAFSTVRRA